MQHERSWSCDSFTVGAQGSALGVSLLGKNSDRPVRECQPVRRHPARKGEGRLTLAYLEIEDRDALAHIGSSPYWCWGHEMGINEAGVAIGNEALFTREWATAVAKERAGAQLQTGLIGMELLRLGLERGETAAKAVETIGSLLEQHGQWAAGTVTKVRADATYDNSFLIVDPNEAYVLETSGSNWAARRVTGAYDAISNEPTIRTHWDRSSPALEARLRKLGYDGDPLDFAEAVVDPQTPLQLSHIRVRRSLSMLGDALAAGQAGFNELRAVLADHYEGTFLDGPAFNPARPDFLTLCMHASPAGFTWGNTAASMVAVCDADFPALWWAPVTPCTSVYVPIAVAGDHLPAGLGTAGTASGTGPSAEGAEIDKPADGSYWWAFMQLLEAVAGDELGTTYAERQPKVRERLDPLQQSWVDAAASAGTDTAAWDELTRSATADALTAARELRREFLG